MSANPHSVRESDAALAEAVVRQWTWKPAAMQQMAVAVCRLALARGAEKFSANDLPEFDHRGRGIAGAVFHRLAKDGVIAPVGVFAGSRFVPEFAFNPGGNPVRAWRLESGARARALLRAQGQALPEMKQVELLIGEFKHGPAA